MSITVNDVFLRAMALCDCLDENGNVIQADHVSVFSARAPLLCDAAQRGLLYYAGFYKTLAFTFTSQGMDVRPLPDDYVATVRLVCDGTDVTGLGSPVRIVGRTIVKDDGYAGNVTLFYFAYPAEVTTLSSHFSYPDGVILATLPYYLASVYLKDEDASLSEHYADMYEKGRLAIKTASYQSEFTELIDAVGTECGDVGPY